MYARVIEKQLKGDSMVASKLSCKEEGLITLVHTPTMTRRLLCISLSCIESSIALCSWNRYDLLACRQSEVSTCPSTDIDSFLCYILEKCTYLYCNNKGSKTIQLRTICTVLLECCPAC